MDPDACGPGFGTGFLDPFPFRRSPPPTAKRPCVGRHPHPLPRPLLMPKQAKELLWRLIDEPGLAPERRLLLLAQLVGLDEGSEAQVVAALRAHGLLQRGPLDFVPGLSFQSDLDDEASLGAGLGVLEGGLDDWMVLMLATAKMPLLPAEVDTPPQLDSPSHCLGPELITELFCSLPPRCRCVEEWLLAHSTLLHGESFSQFYDHVADCPDLLLVVRTTDGDCFGAFVPTPVAPSGPRYFGSRETFLFSSTAGRFTAYPWSHRNEFFVFAMDRQLGVGGGDHFAFFFDGTLANGTTGRCETFQSPSLVAAPPDGSAMGPTADFTVRCLEAWCVGPIYPADLKQKLTVNMEGGVVAHQADYNMFFSPMPMCERKGAPTPQVLSPTAAASSREQSHPAAEDDPHKPFRPRRVMAMARSVFLSSPDPAMDAGGIQRWLRAAGAAAATAPSFGTPTSLPCSFPKPPQSSLRAPSLQSIQSGRSVFSSLREAYADRPTAPSVSLRLLLAVCPSGSCCRAAGLLAAVARRDDWVHLWAAGDDPTPLQRVSSLFVCMEEFHVSWDYDALAVAAPRQGLVDYAARHRIDIVIVGRNTRKAKGPHFSAELLAGLVGSAAPAVWVVNQPLNAFPPSYLLFVDASAVTQRSIRLLQSLAIPGATVWVLGCYKAAVTTGWQTTWVEDADDNGHEGRRSRMHSNYSTASQPRNLTSSYSSTRHVSPPPPPALPKAIGPPDEVARSLVRHARNQLLQTGAGLRVPTCVVGTKDVTETLLDFAKAKAAQTIVCPHHPPSALARLLGTKAMSEVVVARATNHAVLVVL